MCSRYLWGVKGGPEKDALVLAATADVAAVWAEGRPDLAREVGVALVLADQAQVPQVVQPDPGVVRRDEDLVLARHRLYAGHLEVEWQEAGGRVAGGRRNIRSSACLPSPGVLPPGTPDMYGGVVFQLVGREEYTATVVGAHHCELTCTRGVSGSRWTRC